MAPQVAVSKTYMCSAGPGAGAGAVLHRALPEVAPRALPVVFCPLPYQEDGSHAVWSRDA